jgi:hypothetical protein
LAHRGGVSSAYNVEFLLELVSAILAAVRVFVDVLVETVGRSLNEVLGSLKGVDVRAVSVDAIAATRTSQERQRGFPDLHFGGRGSEAEAPSEWGLRGGSHWGQ